MRSGAAGAERPLNLTVDASLPLQLSQGRAERAPRRGGPKRPSLRELERQANMAAMRFRAGCGLWSALTSSMMQLVE